MVFIEWDNSIVQKCVSIQCVGLCFCSFLEEYNLLGVGKEPPVIHCAQKKRINSSNEDGAQAHTFGVHQNRIEFIAVNWISVLLFLMLFRAKPLQRDANSISVCRSFR